MSSAKYFIWRNDKKETRGVKMYEVSYDMLSNKIIMYQQIHKLINKFTSTGSKLLTAFSMFCCLTCIDHYPLLHLSITNKFLINSFIFL